MSNKKYSYDEVYQASLKYFNGDDLAAKVFVDKYALQDKEGKYDELTPDDMHHRLAKEFARIEAKYPNPMSEKEIYELFKSFKYISGQGSPMSGLGNNYQIQSLSNCFVIQGVGNDKLDSYGGIMLADQEMAQVFKRRGGIGFSISGIRPKGVSTSNAAKKTDGIAVFMERFSNTCREVAIHGRRGALLLAISVNHPEIDTFINIKRDLKKVTGANISIQFNDEFLTAVKNNTDYVLRWPVDVSPDKAKMTRTVKAREIWNMFIDSSWTSAEPGALYWSTAIKNTPSDIYADVGYGSTCTNPCFSGETLIAVADGRNAVPIKQLAEEGKDVPVYSVDPATGDVSIKMGRHPRITGYEQSMVRVHLDDGSYIDTTPNHNFLTIDGKKVEAKDLKYGDSLPRFVKQQEYVKKGGNKYHQVQCNVNNRNIRSFEHRLIAEFFQPEKWARTFAEEKKNGWIKGGVVVHHKNYDPLDNRPGNLEIMTFKDHTALHAQADTVGEKNGRYSGFTEQDIRSHAVKLTKQLSKRFSSEEWVSYAKSEGLPQAFSEFRKSQFGSLTELSCWAASEAGLEYADVDQRLVKTRQDMLAQGYSAKISGNVVYVKRTCEHCSCDFEIDHLRREQGYCTIDCYLKKHNANAEMHERRLNNMKETYAERGNELKQKQAKVWSDLKFKLNREPLLKEWEQECKSNSISFRLKTKFGFQNLTELKDAGNNYNHKVKNVELLSGKHTVYNITVDDNHTVGIVTKEHTMSYAGVYVSNCGEIVLSNYDACRLLILNLSSYVNNPFTASALFDYKLFQEHASKAQRLMDDLIDLEIEQIDKIIEKIISDPEPDEVKSVELSLWKKIKEANIGGRRTGLGITALGDALAMLGIKYGSVDSVQETKKIYKTLAVAAHTTSCVMAKERGAFPVFSYEKEKNHKYLNSIFQECDKNVSDLWKEYGRRNIALTTTAPTGSVSTMTQTTSGIEPPYLLSYVRRKKINPNDKEARTDFIDDVGDHWQEFIVYHHGVKKWMDVTGETEIKKSPYWGATSNDVDWITSVDLQAAAQTYVDHSISKTANFPKNASKELISEAYLRAWESGCKGFTVYREGSRTGVLVSEDEHKRQNNITNGRPESISYVMSPKRPELLTCDIKKAKIQGESWTFFVGLMDGKPYEIFGGLSENVELPKKSERGRIRKTVSKGGASRYDLLIGDDDDPFILRDLANVFKNATNGAFTRTISLALRHGVPMVYVTEQLQKDKDSDLTSFSKVLARVLKGYISDGTIATGEKKCPQCSESGKLVYQDGCVQCLSCGFSKCG